MHKTLVTLSAICCLMLLLSGGAARAQDQSLDDRLRDTLRHMTVDLRAAQDSQAALQSQLDQARKQQDMLQQQVATLTARLAQQPATPAPATPAPAAAAAPAADTGEAQQLHQAIDALKQQNASLQDGLSHWQTAYQQAATIARAKDAESRQLGTTAGTATRTLGVCEAKNTKLIGVANDILHLYQTRDFKSLLLGSYEPLLGFKRVELENIVQDNEDRIRDQTYYPNEQPPAPPAAQAAAPPAAQAAAMPAAAAKGSPK